MNFLEEASYHPRGGGVCKAPGVSSSQCSSWRFSAQPLPQPTGPQHFGCTGREPTGAWSGGVPKGLQHSRGRSRRGTHTFKVLRTASQQTTSHPKLAGVEGCGMKSRDAAILQLLISCPWVTKCTFPWLPEFCCQLLWRPCRASHPKCSYPATFLQGIQLQEKNTSSVVIDGRFCSSGRKRWSMVHRGDEHSQGLDLARARSFPLSPVIQMKAQGTGGF